MKNYEGIKPEPITMRPFDQADWDCFGGAEVPAKGEPLIGQFRIRDTDGNWDCGVYLIVDARSVTVFSHYPVAVLNVPFPVGKLVASQFDMLRGYSFADLAEMGFTITRLRAPVQS